MSTKELTCWNGDADGRVTNVNQNAHNTARFAALTVVFLKTQVFWDVTPCCWVSGW